MCKMTLKEEDEETANTLPLIEETPQILNPFVHKLELNSTYNRFKLLVMSIFVLPVRVLGIILSLAFAYILASLGLWGISREELGAKPMTGYRAWLRWYLCFTGRMMMRCYGFQWVKVKGQRAPKSEAPIHVVAPHSTFFDGIVCFFRPMPLLVSRIENSNIPLFGKFIDYTQPIYVYREDQNSRQTTVAEIKRRSWSDEEWGQIMIFPEGTTTNRTCLVSFKPGAFIPGVPIQPIVLRYPNNTDSVTWTWDGPGAFKNIWVTLCQFHNYCEIEYLPVYKPNEEEIKDPFLYARNVRQVMADALGVPVVDYGFDDCKLMYKAKELKLPSHCGLIEFQVLKKNYGCDMELAKVLLKRFAKMPSKGGKVTSKDFSKYLKIPQMEPSLIELFNLYDKDGYGCFTFRDYLIGFVSHVEPSNTKESLEKAFKMFDPESNGFIRLDDLTKCLKTTLDLTPSESLELFEDADPDSKGKIHFDDFASFVNGKPEYAKILSMYQRSVKEKTREKNFKIVSDKPKIE